MVVYVATRRQRMRAGARDETPKNLFPHRDGIAKDLLLYRDGTAKDLLSYRDGTPKDKLSQCPAPSS